nr:MAG TPA: ATP-binding sugar transporter [Bacteriophage sp.]
MNEFKENLKNDLDIFINYDEFAEEYELQGKKIFAVLDDDTMQKASFDKSSDIYDGVYNAVYTKKYTLYVKTKDLKEKIVEGMDIELDSDTYNVKNVEQDMGITILSLERFDTC